MQWNEIIGHGEHIRSLKTMVATANIPHALLFVGREGVGKTTVATVLAAALLCSSKDGKPCGICASCRFASSETHPDLMVVRPDGATIKIEQIREMQREAALAPLAAQRRVFVIEYAENMTIQAANSLLKTLEEPPGPVVFILVSNARHKMLDTILSRCRILTFHSLSHSALAQALLAKGFSPQEAETAARLSGGRMGTALGLLAVDGLTMRNQAAEIAATLLNTDMSWVWDTAASLDKMERQQVLEILHYISYILRDLLMLVTTGDKRLLFNFDIADCLADQVESWNEQRLINAIHAVESARRALSVNAGIRLTCEALLIKLLDEAGEE